MEGDEIFMDIEGFAFHDEFEGEGSVDTAVKVRERLNSARGNRYLLLQSDMMSSWSDWRPGHWI